MDREPDYIKFDYEALLGTQNDMKAIVLILGSMNYEGRIILDTNRPTLGVLSSRDIKRALEHLEEANFVAKESWGSYVVNPSKAFRGPEFDWGKAKRNWKKAQANKEVIPGNGEENYCVYIHYFPNNKYYVGISKDIGTRWGNNGKAYESNPEMYEAIKQYGWGNIRHRVLCANLTKEEALVIEKALIVLYGFKNLYNRI